MNTLMLRPGFDLRDPDVPRHLEGLAEIDQAIHENLLMEYRLKKSWADPWGRKLTIAVLLVIAVGFSYLGGTSLALW